MLRIIIVLSLVITLMGCVQPANTPVTPLPEANDELEPHSPVTPEPEVEEIEENQEEPVPVVEVEEEPIPPAVTFTQPTLTYEGAYNGPLIDTSSQVSGSDVDIDLYIENNNRNGVHAFIGFFGYIGNYPPEHLNEHTGPGFMIDALQRYPGRIIPFFTLGYGAEETVPYVKNLVKYYETNYEVDTLLGGNVLRGIGEIEEYGLKTQPNSSQLKPLFDWASSQNLHIMFHPNAHEVKEVEELVKRYPDTMFIMHMFPEDFSQDRKEIIEVMKNNPNLYYSVDSDHMMYDGETGLLYKYQSFPYQTGAKNFNEDYDELNQKLVQYALTRYRPLIEAVPNQVMWGTELGTRYGHEPASYDRIIQFAREFIGSLKPQHQEKFAYLNAWNAFGPAPHVTTTFSVMDTSDWPTCTKKQDDGCFEECEDQFPNFDEGWEEDSPPDFEACWDMCTSEKKCVVPLVID